MQRDRTPQGCAGVHRHPALALGAIDRSGDQDRESEILAGTG